MTDDHDIDESLEDDVSKFCLPCQRIARLYLEYAEQLDEPIRLIAKLCVGIAPDTETECVGQLGDMLDEHLDKHEVLRGFSFGTPITGLQDDALVKSERVKIAERAGDLTR